ncbi:MAG: RecX family transcriptional regulator [Propionibacteriaceae bacterium]|nr:RecX family transcriptional regulator [Propionibacteriaceae bacterium]
MDQITDLNQAKDIALRRLTVRMRSCQELRQDLCDRDVDGDIADQVVERFLESGLLDDSEFARTWVRSRRRSKSLSSRKLRQELVAKGVDCAVIDQALSSDETSSDLDLAVDLARRRLRAMSGCERETIQRRLSGQLERRGFSYSIVRSAVNTVMDESNHGRVNTDE